MKNLCSSPPTCFISRSWYLKCTKGVFFKNNNVVWILEDVPRHRPLLSLPNPSQEDSHNVINWRGGWSPPLQGSPALLKLKVLVKICRARKDAAFPNVTGSGETKGSAPRRKRLSRAGLGPAPGFLNIPGNVLSYTTQTRRNLTPTTAAATGPLQGIAEIDPAPDSATGKGLSPAISHSWSAPKPLNQKAKMNQKGSQSAHKSLPFSFQPRKKTNKN